MWRNMRHVLIGRENLVHTKLTDVQFHWFFFLFLKKICHMVKLEDQKITIIMRLLHKLNKIVDAIGKRDHSTQ